MKKLSLWLYESRSFGEAGCVKNVALLKDKIKGGLESFIMFSYWRSRSRKQQSAQAAADISHITDSIKHLSHFKSLCFSSFKTIHQYIVSVLVLQTLCFRHAAPVIRTNSLPPFQALNLDRTQSTSDMSSTSSLSFSLHPQKQTCTHTCLFSLNTTLSSHRRDHTSKQHTSHSHAQSRQNTNGIHHVSYFKSLRVSPSPAADLSKYLSLSLKGLCLFLLSHPHP